MAVFKLDTKKAVEAAATLLRLTPHCSMDRKRLLALLYLADRRSLQKTNRPIIGGTLSALQHGPIHSEVYDMIKGIHRDHATWARHFENDYPRVRLRQDVQITALSRYEIDLLAELSDECSGKDTWDVAYMTHFPEWEKNYKGDNSSCPISLEEVIKEVGGDRARILQDAEEKDYFDSIFAGGK
jgi:uncharacterized phage-associated protein